MYIRLPTNCTQPQRTEQLITTTYCPTSCSPPPPPRAVSVHDQRVEGPSGGGEVEAAWPHRSRFSSGRRPRPSGSRQRWRPRNLRGTALHRLPTNSLRPHGRSTAIPRQERFQRLPVSPLLAQEVLHLNVRILVREARARFLEEVSRLWVRMVHVAIV